MVIELDEWQNKILETKGNMCLRSGRQVGKSFIVSIKASKFAVENSKKTILVISATERQAFLLFEKILSYLIDNHKGMIKKGLDRPTKHQINLTNGSKIYSLPTGLSGTGIRGYTIDLLIADEAAFIPNDVFVAVTPMLATTKGDIWLLSTPHGREGYYYDCFNDESYTSFHISSEDCPRISKDYLNKERRRLTKVQYAQEYLGEFIDELRQFFKDELIKKILILQKPQLSEIPLPDRTSISSQNHSEKPFLIPVGDLFLGVDIARMGEDASVFSSLARKEGFLKQFDIQITKKTRLTDTIDKIIELNLKYNYKKIYIDDGGLGSGVYDILLKDGKIGKKIVGLNNSSRPLDRDEKRFKTILKNDLYNNLLLLMEQDKIKLFDDDEIYLSFKSIQYEYNERGQLIIFGDNSHVVESLIRAAWCMKDRSLSLWAR